MKSLTRREFDRDRDLIKLTIERQRSGVIALLGVIITLFVAAYGALLTNNILGHIIFIIFVVIAIVIMYKCWSLIDTALGSESDLKELYNRKITDEEYNK